MNINKVLIVGGGTAGWMSACMLAHHWQSKSVEIVLVESANVGTIGVGEGSTPFLRDFFIRLGICESVWMPACDATYKCGIDFPGWSNNHDASYFHPFYGEIDSEGAIDFFNSCQQKREGFDTSSHPDDYFISQYLAKQHKSPYTSEGKTHGVDYGYHFDAYKLGVFLAQHAKSLGVAHIQDDITSVTHTSAGIQSVMTQHHGMLDADLFIDCSGLNGLLIQQTLGEKLISYQQYLPNNAAVAISTGVQCAKDLGTYTLSKGLEHGWMWSIPLQSRVGNGYVYSSAHINKNQAEARLRDVLGEYDTPALHISWQPGRISQHWKQNCLAVGLSQGFLEPLEAPMLNLVQQTLESFLAHTDIAFDSDQQLRFNTSINLTIDGTRDYLQAHYLTNTRNDSQYWIEARDNTHISAPLKDIVDAWDTPGVFEHALAKHAHALAYGKTSWYCIFAGMNRFAKASRRKIPISKQLNQRHQEICKQRASMYVDQAPHLALLEL